MIVKSEASSMGFTIFKWMGPFKFHKPNIKQQSRIDRKQYWS